jgi:Cof subfamily protein (haloacid dehalogenase superfamily)
MAIIICRCIDSFPSTPLTMNDAVSSTPPLQIQSKLLANAKEPIHNDNSKTYRMVALDLDGTLLASNRQIANVQAEYLNKLHKRGFIIAIATGRAATGVYSHVEKLKIPNMPVVCCNGARGFYCSGNNKTTELFYNPVPKDVVERTISLANQQGYAIQYYYEDYVYANQKTDAHYKLTSLYSEYTGVRVDHVQDDFASLLEQSHMPSKLLVLFDNRYADTARTLVNDEFSPKEATVVKGYCTWFLEILSATVNKGEGLKQLCSSLNIAMDKVIAIGDGCNDIEFLEMAGLGVALQNAEPEVKRVADMSLEFTNDQNGVMRFLQRLEERGELHVDEALTK